MLTEIRSDKQDLRIFQVLSHTNAQKSYTVHVSETSAHCTCPAHQFNPTADCKHIEETREWIAGQEAAEDDRLQREADDLAEAMSWQDHVAQFEDKLRN